MKRLSVLLLFGLVLLSACVTTGTGGLPVIELPAKQMATGAPWFAIFLTGDGGWRKIDAKVSDVLRREGIPVAGLLSNQYFARERTRQEAAGDLDTLIHTYGAKWNRSRVILVGYSRGAEALPILINDLAPATRESIAAVALLGVSMKGSLWTKGPDKYPLVPELTGLGNIPLVCVYGTREKESLCRTMKPSEAKIVAIPGGHHFGGDYERIGTAILDSLAKE